MFGVSGKDCTFAPRLTTNALSSDKTLGGKAFMNDFEALKAAKEGSKRQKMQKKLQNKKNVVPLHSQSSKLRK